MSSNLITRSKLSFSVPIFMPCAIVLAGAAGVIGCHLSPMLVQAGYNVYGTTRKPERCGRLRSMGVEPVLLDVLDAGAVHQAMAHITPDVILNLPPNLNPAAMAEGRICHTHIRKEGTQNLMAAASRMQGQTRYHSKHLLVLCGHTP